MIMKRETICGMLVGIICTAAMVLIEQLLVPTYWIKALIKITLFFLSVVLYCTVFRKDYRELINLKKFKKSRILIVGALLVYSVVIAAYFIFRNLIDMNAIRESLVNKEGLTRENCLFVFSYIILVNSFLEESFFRGFIFGNLKEKSKLAAALISAFLFAVYHIGIVSSWFTPLMLAVTIGALMLAGLFLQTVEEYFDSLAASWFLHGFANLAINTIGFFLIFEI